MLSHVYADKFKSGTPGTYLNFIKARVARIFPLHLVMLTFLALVVVSLPGFTDPYPNVHERFGVSSFIASAVLIQNWFRWLPTAWNTPAWSLSAEWAAYLAFPLFIVATQRWRSVTVCLALAAASLGVLIAVLVARGLDNPAVEGTFGMVRMAAEFCAGCLIYRAQKLGLRNLPSWADMLAIAALGVSLFVPGTIYLSLFALALIVLLAGQDAGPIARFLSLRPILFLGEISFSIYLVHWIVIQLSTWAAPPGTWFDNAIRDFSVICITLLISYGTYVSVELRSRAWGRKIGLKPKLLAANSDAI